MCQRSPGAMPMFHTAHSFIPSPKEAHRMLPPSRSFHPSIHPVNVVHGPSLRLLLHTLPTSTPVNKSSTTGHLCLHVGRNGGNSSPAPSSQPPPSALPELHSNTSLPASSSAGTSLPTSVGARKSSTAWLHLPSVRRFRILNLKPLCCILFLVLAARRIYSLHFLVPSRSVLL